MTNKDFFNSLYLLKRPKVFSINSLILLKYRYIMFHKMFDNEGLGLLVYL